MSCGTGVPTGDGCAAGGIASKRCSSYGAGSAGVWLVLARKGTTQPTSLNYQEALEEQEQILGPDPWEYGLTEQNRKTLEMLAGFSHEQGLTRRRLSLDELFLPVFQGRKRGDEHRI